ncbi:hypothetical protein LK492_19610, partial [Phocaeicola vulgatus]|nr:hypothetical protein [Phocaeicola vulgatus]
RMRRATANGKARYCNPLTNAAERRTPPMACPAITRQDICTEELMDCQFIPKEAEHVLQQRQL